MKFALRVVSVEKSDGWSKVGPMLRESLKPDARNFAVLASSAGTAGPVDRSTAFPVLSSVVMTCTGTAASCRRSYGRCRWST